MSTPNQNIRTPDTEDIQTSPQIANHDHLDPNQNSDNIASAVTEPANSTEDHSEAHLTDTSQESPSPNENGQLNNNRRSARIHVAVSYTVSTVSPRAISPLLLPTLMHYPRQFENFTQNELINCLTNYENRHVQSFRALKAQSVPEASDTKAVFYSVSEPDIPLRSYVSRLVTYSRVARIHFLMMVIYVDRIAATSVALIPSEQNVHRLLAAGLAVAARQHDALNADHARRVAGLASTHELFKIMNALLHFINQDISTSREDMHTTFNRLNAMRHTTDVANEDNMSSVTAPASTTETQNMTEESNGLDDTH